MQALICAQQTSEKSKAKESKKSRHSRAGGNPQLHLLRHSIATRAAITRISVFDTKLP